LWLLAVHILRCMACDHKPMGKQQPGQVTQSPNFLKSKFHICVCNINLCFLCNQQISSALTYCTILIDLDVTHHGYHWFVQNVTLVLHPKTFVQNYLLKICPNMGI
jgi:hypothetical protein